MEGDLEGSWYLVFVVRGGEGRKGERAWVFGDGSEEDRGGGDVLFGFCFLGGKGDESEF